MDEIESLPIPAGVASLAMEQAGGLSLSRSSGPEGLLELAGRSDEEKKKLAQDFESVFIAKIFDQVKESIGNWGLEEDGASRQIQGLFWHYLAQDVADKGGFGLWQDIYRQFQELEDAGETGASLDGTL
ncbi:MAG: hypothetical protein JW741_30910 [Sedimentisphaerales bacterium]|nr:hypothetical protein [Sedimentisphaerales bacterium]